MRKSVLCMVLITLQISIVLPTKYADQYEESIARINDSDNDGVNDVFSPKPMVHEETKLMAATQQALVGCIFNKLCHNAVAMTLLCPSQRYPRTAVISASDLRSDNNINCNDSSSYAVNCTEVAGMMYGFSRKAPPMADKLQDWCNALMHLTNCASDWNSECKDVSEYQFHQDRLEGHIHVVDNVCLDTNFTSRYKDASSCIEDTTSEWEFCYSHFKDEIDEFKNSSLSWTHYQTHFTLCCARAVFRACTLGFLFTKPSCTRDQATTMQRFSVIVSEGDVHQDCEKDVNYVNCPGGDPQPKAKELLKLKGIVENVPSLTGVKAQGDMERNFGKRNRLLSVLIPVYFLFVCKLFVF